jgi:hypothetical protein
MESAGNGYSRQNQIGLAMDSLGKLTRQTGGGAGALIPFVRFDRIRRQVKQKFNLDKLLTYRFLWTAPWPLGLGGRTADWSGIGYLGGIGAPAPRRRVVFLFSPTPRRRGARIRLEASGFWKTGREGRRRRGRVSLRFLDSNSTRRQPGLFFQPSTETEPGPTTGVGRGRAVPTGHSSNGCRVLGLIRPVPFH